MIGSRPNSKTDVFDGILAGYVNGQRVKTAENDRVYYFTGKIPAPLKADGKFATLEIPIPSDAKYLTLVSTGAGIGPGENTISSDHAVFSGARLELNPIPLPATIVAAASNETVRSETEFNQARLDARLLSELFYDQGLLALPGEDAAGRLPDMQKEQLAGLRAELDRMKKEFDGIQVLVAHSLMDGQGRDLPIYLQGNPTKQGDVVPRAMPVVFTQGQRSPLPTNGSGRAELANSIASNDNPLTARVIVNRVWRSHFGFGLVRTPSNFGQLGDRPTHPKLLDDLAVRFMDSGWSLKTLHREILLSATYQQRSDFRSDASAVDPENRLLWRMNRRRLEVEPWRDAMLAVTGELDRTVGGPPVNLAAGNNLRRTLYSFISRHQLNDLLRLFDFPDPNITSDRRSVTTVPLQQLFVLNSDFMTQRAKSLVARLDKDSSRATSVDRESNPTVTENASNENRNSGKPEPDAIDTDAKIRRLFGWLFGRQPSDAELRFGKEFLSSSSSSSSSADSSGNGLSVWEQYALALLGTNEFSFVD